MVSFGAAASNPEDTETTPQWDIFKLQRKILLIFGVWPADRLVRPWYVKVLIAINLATLAICMVGEFLHGLYAYQEGDLSESIESICPTVARISGFLRMVFYLANEEKIHRVLNNISKTLQGKLTVTPAHMQLEQQIRKHHPKTRELMLRFQNQTSIRGSTPSPNS